MVVGGVTEPCEFVFQTITARVQFAVADVPPQIRTEIEGMLPWYPFREAVLVVDAERETVTFTNAVPNYAKSWPRFDLLTNSQVLGFKIPGADAAHNCIYVDTGSPDGAALDGASWNDLFAHRGDAPVTLNASYSLATGLTISTQMWAKQLALGPLIIKDVPAQEVEPAFTNVLGPNHAATLGMYALRRLSLVVDGSNGVVYARASEKPPPPYTHNRAGVAFVPQDFRKDGPLYAHVVPGGPAFMAGVRDGDVLLRIDDLNVARWFSDPQIKPNSLFREAPAGTMLTLMLRREDRGLKAVLFLKDILGPMSWQRSSR
jgi:hypothetical protein